MLLDAIRLIFLCFGIETNGNGLTLNDFYGMVKYNAMFDRKELIRSLIYVFGEQVVIEKLSV
eukprot:jgi/Orpsp1_1/1184735/evm.model.c7180000090768.1